MITLLLRNYRSLNPPIASKSAEPLNFGILGAAAIAPKALIVPARNHPEVVVFAVAARDQVRAAAYAKKYGIEKAYGGANGYQELLDDPHVRVVYNALPNGLHYEWTMKALLAGKHVLLEKPAADTVEETRTVYELASRKGLVLLEAFHYRFHPAIQRVKAIVSSGELGKVKSIEAKLTVPHNYFKEGDIRFNYALGGGVMMDMGCYTLNVMRYLSSANPLDVVSASAIPYVPSSGVTVSNIDRYTTATLSFPNDITGTLTADAGMPRILGLIPRWPQVSVMVECDGGSVKLENFVAPSIYHSITVDKRYGHERGRRVEKAYTLSGAKVESKVDDKDWWTTYRYQLEAFVDRVKGREPQIWVDEDDTVANMKWIEKIYEKTGMGVRPMSNYK